MSDSSTFARLRDFSLISVGSVGLFFAVLLVLMRLRFPGMTQSNLGGAFWVYLGAAIAVTVCCAGAYARVDSGLSNRPPGV